MATTLLSVPDCRQQWLSRLDGDDWPRQPERCDIRSHLNGPSFSDAISLQPSLLAGVVKAKATHLTPMGQVGIAWKHDGTRASIKVSIPAGARAQLLLPFAKIGLKVP